MNDGIRFIVVEDKAEDRREVLSQLSDVGFVAENKLGVAETYEDAKELLEEYADRIDVVFLNLNIPRSLTDGRPEKSHGKAILEIIHADLNRRVGNDIKVIVVSGEDLQDGVYDKLFLEVYRGTLLGIVQKAELQRMLKASVRRLRKDPMRSRLRRAELDVVDHYDTVIDSGSPIKERLKSARSLAIRLAQNEVDHHLARRGASEAYADDLNGLIKDHIESRFSEDSSGQRRIKSSQITTPGGWGAFLWRGAMVQHLYAINSYRNRFEHAAGQSYRNQGQAPDTWSIPAELLHAVEDGGEVGKLAEITVRELLTWYLPWHEQVYLPWSKGSIGGRK